MSRPNDPARVSLFVNGTLMRGEPLHANLSGARFIGPARTAPRYRLLSVRDLHPAMVPAGTGPGAAISGELYELDLAQLQHVLEHEPPGLGLGVVELEDGTRTMGILWTAPGMPEAATDISGYGGWREYRTALSRTPGALTAAQPVTVIAAAPGQMCRALLGPAGDQPTLVRNAHQGTDPSAVHLIGLQRSAQEA